MVYVHLLMAIVAAWRITELFTQDRITSKLREKFPTYLWQCPRCMSVWAGAWCALVYALGQRWPMLLWLNWPFALAWFYLTHVEWLVTKRLAEKGRRFTIELDNKGSYKVNSDLSHTETLQLLSQVMRQFAPNPVVNGEAKPS